MDKSFAVKRLKTNKIINRPTCGSIATLHISELIVGLRYQTSLQLVIRTMVLQMELANAMGPLLIGFVGCLPDNCFPSLRRKVTMVYCNVFVLP